jgi:hypothetical protein
VQGFVEKHICEIPRFVNLKFIVLDECSPSVPSSWGGLFKQRLEFVLAMIVPVDGYHKIATTKKSPNSFLKLTRHTLVTIFQIG